MVGSIPRLDVNFRIIRICLVVLAAFWLVSCGSGDSGKITRVSRIAMGTLVEISVSGSAEKAGHAIEAAFDEIKRIEDLTSFHKSSGLTELNNSAGKGPVQPGAELTDLIKRSLEFSDMSGGAFDPTIGPLAQLWNFSGESGPRLPELSEIQRVLPLVGWKFMKVDAVQGLVELTREGMSVDLGAIAKGYALERASAKLRENGVTSGLINAGGDIVAFGKKGPDKPWRVGIQDPRNPSGVIAVAAINDRAVVTSGDYERYFFDSDKRYHHLLDPKTGFPADRLQSVTIVAPDAVTADALSTAVFVMGKDEGLALIESQPDVAGLMVDSEGRVILSQRALNIFQTRN